MRLLKLFGPLIVLVVWTSLGWSEEPTRGTIKNVSAGDNQIVVTDKNGKDWSYQVLDNVALFMAGEPSPKLEAFKTGEEVSLLWEKKGDQLQACAILLHKGDFKNAQIAAATIKSPAADDKSITATDADGKERTYQLMDNAKIRLNNRRGRLSDFKSNDRIVVVCEKEGDQHKILAMCEDPISAQKK